MALAALILGGCGGAQPLVRQDLPDDFRRGVALGVFAAEEELDYDDMLREIRGIGASDVSLVFTIAVDDAAASRVYREPGRSPEPAAIERIARRARARGLRVTVFPIVRLVHRTAAEWRGTLHPSDLARFHASYEEVLAGYASAAARGGAAELVVGSELVSLEGDPAWWRGLIARTRRLFPGRLIYSANWDRYDRVPFWDAVDALGVSAYFELSKRAAPTVEELVAAWRPIRARLVAYAASQRRPLVLTEIGYPSVAAAASFPWNDFLVGPDGAEDAEAQRRLYEAFVRGWSDGAGLAGTYFWMWFGRGGPGDRSYTPRWKPAELVLKEWYHRRALVPPPR